MDWLDSLSPVQGFALSDEPYDFSPNRLASLSLQSNDGHNTSKAPQVPMEIPRGPPRSWDRGAMIKRIRVGMMIELSTIPLYLYAMYSVKPTQNQLEVQVRATLRGSADPPKPLPSASLMVFSQAFCSRKCSISPWPAISLAQLEAL